LRVPGRGAGPRRSIALTLPAHCGGIGSTDQWLAGGQEARAYGSLCYSGWHALPAHCGALGAASGGECEEKMVRHTGGAKVSL
jgi:hypothetical protein